MFKSILPSKRLPSADFTMITNLGDAAKENQPEAGSVQSAVVDPRPVKPLMKKKKSFAMTVDKKKTVLGKDCNRDQPMEAIVMNQAFDKLLDELQIPSTLRPKLSTMDSTVKAAMLKSSQAMTPSTPPSPPLTPRSALRRTRSSESLDSPRLAKSSLDYDFPRPPPIFASRPSSPQHTSSVGAHPRVPSGLARVASFDLTRVLSKNTPAVLPADSALAKSTKDKGFVMAKNISPAKFFGILSGTSSTQLDVENVKKLRLLLRNESASWSQEFLKLGGYAALLTRLNEILEVEWREEQHDDQILHELLRCFKALSTSAIGCFALRSSCPRPFVQLVALLYSDKKPGEVATRQLIVDLLLILFDLYPSSSLPSSESNGRKSAHARSRTRREVWESESSSPSTLVSLPSPHKTFYSLIQALLLTPAPPPSESPAAPISPHAFIESLHRPRIYKNYLQELSDVCRDYFWVFCHPNNTIWVLKQTDETRVEKPRAPGGMTGGVEFEAIGYFTTHLKLVNAIAKAAADLNLPKEHDHSAYRFHSDLFLSGIERIIVISRKASITYYPTLHLELARYVSLAGAAGFDFPWTVSRLVGMPPQALCKNTPVPALATGSPATSPKKRGDAPMLPSPQKVEPIKFD